MHIYGPRSIYIFNVNNQRLLHDIFHIDLVLARNAHIKLDSEAGGLIWVVKYIRRVEKEFPFKYQRLCIYLTNNF
jgi:hypothetical protein